MPPLTNLEPHRVIPGGRLWVHGESLPTSPHAGVTIGGTAARISFASPSRLAVHVPTGVDSGTVPVKLDSVPGATLYAEVGRTLATGLHQVDSPVPHPDGSVFVTYSGSRGQDVPISVFRVTPDGAREPYVHSLVNATSLALGPDGRLYVSSRFEGRVYRIGPDGTADVIASELGIATGLAFGHDGSLYVGDRSGTIFRIDSKGRTEEVAAVPPSVAAFHLAMGHDGWLYLAAPTLASFDPLRRVRVSDGTVEPLEWTFGRPQGLAFDGHGVLHVVEALAGGCGVYALRPGQPRELVVGGRGLVGVAFGQDGRLFVCSADTLYGFA